MRKAYIRGALVAALLAAGCGVGSNVDQVPDSLGAPGLTAKDQAFLKSTAATSRYKLLTTSTNSATKAAATVTVSSTRNETWFGAKHLTDAKLTSAWGPAADDDAPTITMDLGACMDVSALSIKMSGGATMNVEAMVDGAWTTVATGVTTTAGQLDMVELDADGATALRITFMGDTTGLLVCDVACWGTPCATPTAKPSVVPTTTPSVTPSTTPSVVPSVLPSVLPSVVPSVLPSVLPSVIPSIIPSVIPSVEPTATPTPEPTPTPTPAPCCKAVTGNGNIEAEGVEGTFKFEINTPSGRVNFRGPGGGQTFLPILSAVCIENGVIVTADANNDGTGDTTFTLLGEAQGGHLKTVSCTIDGDLSLFPDFLTPVTDIQGSLNIFDDPDCDGTPN